MTSQIVISGSGISGLICALVLAERGEGPRILLVEKNSRPGGLLRRVNYGDWGDFDYGMHNIMETGIEELDDLLFDVLPEEEWQLLEGPERDIAGLYLNGVLQRHTPYIDLRSLPRRDYEICVAALFEHFSVTAGEGTEGQETSSQTAEDYAVGRFGPVVAHKTIVPAIEKIYQRPASHLDYMATRLTPLTRLAFCGEPLIQAMTAAPFLRDRLAWCDQRTLPLERSSRRRAMYPAQYGMYRVVDAIVKRVAAAGVRLMTNAEITGAQTTAGKVRALQIRHDGQTHTIDDVKRLIWSAPIPMLGRHLGVDFTGLVTDKPLTTVVANLVVDRLPEAMADLYYFFCYDPAFRTFRLTNFTNYSRGAARNGGYPISLELLMQDAEPRGVDLAAMAVDEYRRFGISRPAAKVLFAKVEPLETGFPMPTVNNVRAIRRIRRDILGMGLSNLHLVGVLAEDNLFFQTDVLAHAFKTIH